VRTGPDAAAGGSFGAVLVPPRTRYRPGDTVRAEFVGASPNNDLRRGSTFLEVQAEQNGSWVRVADDGDWATRFEWRRVGRRGSSVVLRWDVPADAAAGRYRLLYNGDVCEPDGRLRPFAAPTDPFEVG
jgi:neutral ceramidase